MPGEPDLQRVDLLPERTAVADDAARPAERALALGRERLEARAALHEEHAKRVLQLLDAGGKRRLRYAAGLGRAPEMLLLRKRQQEFQLVDHCEFTRSRRPAHVARQTGRLPPLQSLRKTEDLYLEAGSRRRITRASLETGRPPDFASSGLRLGLQPENADGDRQHRIISEDACELDRGRAAEALNG